MNIKKNDTVIVLSGKSKGKKGKVLTAMPKENKLLVEGVNVATCHVKAVSGIMGIIADSLDSIEIYTLGGIRIADTTDLVPGFYIVRYVRDGVTVTEKKRF